MILLVIYRGKHSALKTAFSGMVIAELKGSDSIRRDLKHYLNMKMNERGD